MLRRKRFYSLQLNYQLVIYKKINKILTDTISIFIENVQRFLPLNLKTRLLQSMLQRSFIDFLKQTNPKILMHAIGYLPNFCGKDLKFLYTFYMFYTAIYNSHLSAPE